MYMYIYINVHNIITYNARHIHYNLICRREREKRDTCRYRVDTYVLYMDFGRVYRYICIVKKVSR